MNSLFKLRTVLSFLISLGLVISASTISTAFSTNTQSIRGVIPSPEKVHIDVNVIAQTPYAWRQAPGSAWDVGNGWVIGTDEEAGGYGIYRWTGSTWEKVSGSAVRIGGNPSNPLVVNTQGEIYRWSGSSWIQLPGSATDVGDDWVIGTDEEAGGYGIHRWTGSTWEKVSGSAVRIGGSRSNPLVVNAQGEIYRWNGSSWTLLPGSAKDVGDNWVIGTDREAGGYGIHRWTGSTWEKVSGSGIGIGGDYNNPLVVNKQGEIYQSNR